MFTDFYSRAVLTFIAIALSIIAVNPWIAPQRVDAASSQDGIVTAILTVVTSDCKRELPEYEDMRAQA